MNPITVPSFDHVPRGAMPIRYRRMHMAALVLATVTEGNRLGSDEPREFADPFDAMFADSFDNAVALYESSQWPASFEMLTRLADRGEVPAAQLALLMLRYGAPVYGVTLSATPPQVARWAKQVLRQPVDAHESAVGLCHDGAAGQLSGAAALSLAASRAPSRAPRPRPDRSPPSRSSSTSCTA